MLTISRLGAECFCRLVVALLVSTVVTGSALALDDEQCRKAAPAMEIDSSLLLGKELTASRPNGLTIVAIGSSSTAGHGNVTAGVTYPAVLERSLREEQSQAVTVLNRGRGGETIPDMVARFDRDVISEKPDLVIWQLGVNDVLTRDGVEDNEPSIERGIANLVAHDIPVLLLDLQYAPRVNSDRDTPVMQAMIRHAVDGRRRVVQLKRYAAMQHLAEAVRVPMAEMVDQDGLHMTVDMHRCLGKLIAHAIVDAVQPAVPFQAGRREVAAIGR